MESSTLKAYVKIYNDSVKFRLQSANRLRYGPDKAEFKAKIKEMNSNFRRVETLIKKGIDEEARQSWRVDQEHEEMYHWLTSQRGISTVLAGGFMAYTYDIKNFSNVSKLYTYSGMGNMDYCTKCKKERLDPERKEKRIQSHIVRFKHLNEIKKDPLKKKSDAEIEKDVKSHFCTCSEPVLKKGMAQRRVSGGLVNFNPDFQTLCFNIGESLIRSKNENYYPLYLEFKSQYALREGETKSHIHAMARRKMIKIWIQQTWEHWRVLENLPAPGPYAIDILKHADKISFES
jgi:hypothetical protein